MLDRLRDRFWQWRHSDRRVPGQFWFGYSTCGCVVAFLHAEHLHPSDVYEDDGMRETLHQPVQVWLRSDAVEPMGQWHPIIPGDEQRWPEDPSLPLLMSFKACDRLDTRPGACQRPAEAQPPTPTDVWFPPYSLVA